MSKTPNHKGLLAAALTATAGTSWGLPLLLPLFVAVPVMLVVVGVGFWVVDRTVRRLPEPDDVGERGVAPVKEVPPPPPPPPPPAKAEPADYPGPQVRVLTAVAWDLHRTIIERIRSQLGPLSSSLFGIKNDLRHLLAKAGELESSFRNDSSGLHQTVHRFEQQSRTIDSFAHEMDSSVQEFQRSSKEMAGRFGAITQAIHQINDVAERIKVLSINASIEAARAGAQGAGFKVISQEVRRLAEDTNQFSAQAEKTISEAIGQVQGMFDRFIQQYQNRTEQMHQIRATTSDLERFLKDLFTMIEGIFRDYDGFVGSLEIDLDKVSPTLQQAEIGTQQVENTWKGIQAYTERVWGIQPHDAPELPASEWKAILDAFAQHLTTTLEAEVVDAWARKRGITLSSTKKTGDDITLF